MLLVCGKAALTLTDLQTIFRTVLAILDEETEPGFLSSLYKCIVDSMLVLPNHSLPPDLTLDILAATKRKLYGLAQDRKKRSAHLFSQSSGDVDEDQEDMALLEQLEDFALDEMARFCRMIDPNHPLLVAISSVRDLTVVPQDY